MTGARQTSPWRAPASLYADGANAAQRSSDLPALGALQAATATTRRDIVDFHRSVASAMAELARPQDPDATASDPNRAKRQVAHNLAESLEELVRSFGMVLREVSEHAGDPLVARVREQLAAALEDAPQLRQSGTVYRSRVGLSVDLSETRPSVELQLRGRNGFVDAFVRNPRETLRLLVGDDDGGVIGRIDGLLEAAGKSMAARDGRSGLTLRDVA